MTTPHHTLAELRAEARTRDENDPLRPITDLFVRPRRPLYFDGNSLGPLSRPAREAVMRTVRQWGDLAVSGWSEGDPSWFDRERWLSRRLAPALGARPGEISLGGSTTQQIHQLLATFYRPAGTRTALLVDAGAFPTDRYAAESHVRLHGLDPTAALRTVAPDASGFLDPAALAAAFTGDVALAILPSVVYTTGQRLPMPELSRAAREAGVFLIWDLCHSAGLVPHHLHDDGVEAAVFCTYKYLNGGPGSPAGVFLHERHWPPEPGLWGWWGSAPSVQFQMAPTFVPAQDASGLQLGTPSMLALAPLEGSLDILEQAGIEAVFRRAQELTGFLIEAAEALVVPYGMTIGTPRETERRGGHIALRHPEALAISRALKIAGVTPDFRPPDIIRLCPAPLFTRFRDVVEALARLRVILREERFRERLQDDSPVW
jgi:kynureninase